MPFSPHVPNQGMDQSRTAVKSPSQAGLRELAQVEQLQKDAWLFSTSLLMLEWVDYSRAKNNIFVWESSPSTCFSLWQHDFDHN